ncbi:MAG: ribosome maturation factor RimM [Rhodocyclales bacterium]|nr:ribosome maturation factor RimM [Rhodocyclales bacterium]
MASSSGQHFVILGKIVGAYGVQGWVRVHPFADDPHAWGKLSAWWLGREDAPPDNWRELAVVRSRVHLGAVVAQLEGVADRDAAEALKGTLVGVPRAALPPAGKDEYYWDDLIGLEVVNVRGEGLGKVESLIETGANDVLCVRADDGRELLLPFVGAVVLDVDLAAKRIRVEWEADW